MKTIEQLVRPNIRTLKPYSSARDEFTGSASVFLDANENPYGTLNRYPDPYQRQLKSKLAEVKGVNSNQIFIGNGSDEAIDLLFRVFCRPGMDTALAFTPSYGMYRVSAEINDVELEELALDADFQPNVALVLPRFVNPRLKLLFLCAPNNPTGNLPERKRVEEILNNFNGLVIMDEAYADFSSEESWVKDLDRFPNLVVLQTFSKAWGLAAARVGMLFANPEIIQWLNAVKPPYNVSALNQQAVLQALDNVAAFEQRRSDILNEKERLNTNLSKLPQVQKIYPSEANFLLIKVENATRMYQQLVEQGVIVRNRSSQLENTLRISVGSPEENDKLIEALKTL